MPKRRALVVGVNRYADPRNDLRGCVNDALWWSNVLTTKFGFDAPKAVRMLLDQRATTANIVERLHWLVDGAEPGDTLVFAFSGHGTQVVDTDYTDGGPEEPDGLDEALCPHDLSWDGRIVTDDTLGEIFGSLPEGVQLLIASDSCHSGDLRRNVLDDVSRGKFVAPPMDIVARNPVARSTVYENDAAVQAAVSGQLTRPDAGYRKTAGRGILVSGCRSDQTSMDSYIGRKYCGAFTYFLGAVLREYNYDVTYQQLVRDVNRNLRKFGYEQEPQLECPSEWRDRKFLR
jgi:hypothetical protein